MKGKGDDGGFGWERRGSTGGEAEDGIWRKGKEGGEVSFVPFNWEERANDDGNERRARLV